MLTSGQPLVRSWTRALRYPKVIGRLPGMRRLWGGPYTYAQIATGALTLLLMVKTLSLWGRFGPAGNGLLLLILPAGLMFAVIGIFGRREMVRRARIEGRSLPAYVSGLSTYAARRVSTHARHARASVPSVLAPHTLRVSTSAVESRPQLVVPTAATPVLTAARADIAPAVTAPVLQPVLQPVQGPAQGRSSVPAARTAGSERARPVTNLERLLAAAAAAQPAT